MPDRYLWLLYVGVAGLAWGTYIPVIFFGGNELSAKPVELFQLAERLSLENGLHLLPIGRTALAQNELAHRAEAGRRDLLPFMVERLMMLEGSQTRQLFGR